MTDDDLDRILSGQADIVPSSGFVNAVMDAVRREASEPPPIPFPWSRALPAVAAGVLTLVALIVALVNTPGRPAIQPDAAGLLTFLAHELDLANMYGVGWLMLALLATLASIALSMRLTAGRWRGL